MAWSTALIIILITLGEPKKEPVFCSMLGGGKFLWEMWRGGDRRMDKERKFGRTFSGILGPGSEKKGGGGLHHLAKKERAWRSCTSVVEGHKEKGGGKTDFLV